MATPSSRTRSKVVLNPSRVSSASLPISVVSQVVLSNVAYVAALDAAKDWLLAPDTHLGVFWVLIRSLAFAALAVMIFEGMTGELGKRFNARIEWTVLGVSSFMLFVQQATLLTALYRISATRVIMFTNFYSFWMDSLIRRESTRKPAAVVLAVLLSFVSDMDFTLANMKRAIPGYAVLAIYGISSFTLEHTQAVLSPALGYKATSMVNIIGATVIALPFYVFRTLVYEQQDAPAVSLVSLTAIPVLSYSLLYLSPVTRDKIKIHGLAPKSFLVSFASTLCLSLVLGTLAFQQFPTWTDWLVCALLFYGSMPDSTEAHGGQPKTSTGRLAKTYLKTILANPESRKIFYFLVLNLAFMLVQMLYGVWTNSLGLISDAIHMAFDCMAIAMGLFASVMATWPPNERFTYGYCRIETVSGFANGIFLILISIFIVFEAIQRILNPPEMNTNQLLLVSSLGLGVNLFGMFAMGGHHHHGHSHSHGHSHGHDEHGHTHSNDHAHSHSPEVQVSLNRHSHSHDHHPVSSPDHSSCNHPHDDDHTPTQKAQSHQSSFPSHLHGKHLEVNGLASPPSSAPPTAARFHTRSVSLHIPPGGNATPPILNGRPNGHSQLAPHSGHPGRHIRTPSLIPNAQDIPNSPMTPSYNFGHDQHFAEHHDHSHSHGSRVPNLHDHSHSHSHGSGHEGHSHNMRGVFLHVMADTLGSVGVIVSTLLIQFYGWTGFDPIASLFIAILIAASVVPLVIDTGKILCLDIGDREHAIKKVLDELPMIEGLASYSSPRFWPKDDSSLIGSIHIRLEKADGSSTKSVWAPVDQVVERVDTLLRNKILGLEELTIQVEG